MARARFKPHFLRRWWLQRNGLPTATLRCRRSPTTTGRWIGKPTNNGKSDFPLEAGSLQLRPGLAYGKNLLIQQHLEPVHGFAEGGEFAFKGGEFGFHVRFPVRGGRNDGGGD